MTRNPFDVRSTVHRDGSSARSLPLIACSGADRIVRNNIQALYNLPAPGWIVRRGNSALGTWSDHTDGADPQGESCHHDA